MEKTLFEWENAMQRMVTDRENDRIEHARSIEFLKEKIEKANTERDLVKKEAEAVLLKYKQARIDNQDLVESETLLKAKTSQLEQDLASSLQKFNALKTHAQDKLAEANSEIHKVRTTLESKLAATITKLDRANIAVSTLEAGLASKTAENLELTRICDGLVMQIEGMSN